MTATVGIKSVKDGLIFHYDLTNDQKSWKGKPTTNLVPDPTFELQNWNTWSGRGVDSWSYEIFDGSPCAVTDFTINTGQLHHLYKNITIPAVLTTYSLVGYVYVTHDFDGVSPVFINQEYPFGDYFSIVYYDLTKKGTWQKLYSVRNNAYTTNDADPKDRYRVYFGYGGTDATAGKIYFKMVQLEEGDIRSKFVNGTRSSTQSILDLSNTNTITIQSLTYRQDQYPYFNNPNYVDLPDSLGYTTEVSAFAWFKSLGTPTGGFHIVMGAYDLEISVPNGGALRTGIRNTSLTRYVNDYGSGLTDGNWHHIGFTFDGTTKKVYIDSMQVGLVTNFFSGTLNHTFSQRRIGRFGSSINYYANAEIPIVKIYNKALTSTEVKNNFEAKRTFFGV